MSCIRTFIYSDGPWLSYQIVVDALVELPLSRTALPQLVISVVEALPVLAELSQAVGVDVLDTVDHVSGRPQP